MPQRLLGPGTEPGEVIDAVAPQLLVQPGVRVFLRTLQHLASDLAMHAAIQRTLARVQIVRHVLAVIGGAFFAGLLRQQTPPLQTQHWHRAGQQTRPRRRHTQPTRNRRLAQPGFLLLLREVCHPALLGAHLLFSPPFHHTHSTRTDACTNCRPTSANHSQFAGILPPVPPNETRHFHCRHPSFIRSCTFATRSVDQLARFTQITLRH